jgi:hypothetical protein
MDMEVEVEVGDRWPIDVESGDDDSVAGRWLAGSDSAWAAAGELVEQRLQVDRWTLSDDEAVE